MTDLLRVLYLDASVAKEMGGLILMLSVMLFFAYRDPARNAAIVNAFIVGLCVLAITPCYLSTR